MCGIVGLLIKKKGLRDSLGEHLLPMFNCMADRGPDSAGLAVFSDPVDQSGEKRNRRFAEAVPDFQHEDPETARPGPISRKVSGSEISAHVIGDRQTGR